MCSMRAPRWPGDQIVTSGGRVLCVTALGDTVKIAQKRAYEVATALRLKACRCDAILAGGQSNDERGGRDQRQPRRRRARPRFSSACRPASSVRWRARTVAAFCVMNGSALRAAAAFRG